MFKKILSTITMIFVLCTTILPVYGQENTSGCDGGCPMSSNVDFESMNDYTEDEYINAVQSVEASSYYSEQSSRLYDSNQPHYLYKINESEDSMYTVTYFYNENNKRSFASLVFVLDSGYNIQNVIQTQYIGEDIVMEDLANDGIQVYSTQEVDCRTFQCTQYQVTGGNTDAICAFLVGAACTAVAPAGMAGYVLCYAGIVTACNTPAGRTCVTGVWRNVCPM